jgi:hypothetical protein
VSRKRLRNCWQAWCARQGQHPGTDEQFGVNLHSLIPKLEIRRRRVCQERERVYVGVYLPPQEVTGGPKMSQNRQNSPSGPSAVQATGPSTLCSFPRRDSGVVQAVHAFLSQSQRQRGGNERDNTEFNN